MIRLFRAFARLKANNQHESSAPLPKLTSAKLIDAESDQVIDDSSTPIRQHHPIKQSFHHRSNGSKLPLSSFLDPYRIEQRHRHRHRTPKPAAPTYAELSPARQKLARNPYAQILAQPVRQCAITDANLPSSLLLKFNELRDPAGALTLVPLALWNDAFTPGKGEGGRLLKERGQAQSLPLNREVVQFLADVQEDGGSLKDQLRSHEAKMAVGSVATIEKLMAELFTKTMRWSLSHGSKDYFSLDNGLEGLRRLCDAGEDISAVLFFGGRLQSQKIAELEAKVEALVLDVDNMLLRWQLESKTHKFRGWHRIRRADPRAIYSPVDFFSVKIVSANNVTLRIPVIPMIDIMGQQAACKLVKDTSHESSTWIAVRSSIGTADHVAKLLACSFWVRHNAVPK